MQYSWDNLKKEIKKLSKAVNPSKGNAICENAAATLTSYNGDVLDYQFEIVSIDMYDNPIYIIKNSSGQLARLNRTNITPEYLQQTTPAHLAISFTSRTAYDAFADGSQQQEDYHFQFGNQAELTQGGMRRVINSAEIDYKPHNGAYYKIKLYSLPNRNIFIRRPSYAHPDQGVATSIYEGSTRTTETEAGDVFKVLYDAGTDKYRFLDYTYLQQHATGPFITDTMEVYLGEENIHSLDFTYGTTPGNYLDWELEEATPTNVNDITSDIPDAFLIKTAFWNSSAYLYHHNAFSSTQSGYSDAHQSVDPIGLYTGNNPSSYGLFKFERVYPSTPAI